MNDDKVFSMDKNFYDFLIELHLRALEQECNGNVVVGHRLRELIMRLTKDYTEAKCLKLTTNSLKE